MIAWAALVLALLELAFLLAVVWLVMRVWRQAAPTVKPMLAMFGNVPAGTTSTNAAVTFGQSETTAPGE